MHTKSISLRQRLKKILKAPIKDYKKDNPQVFFSERPEPKSTKRLLLRMPTGIEDEATADAAAKLQQGMNKQVDIPLTVYPYRPRNLRSFSKREPITDTNMRYFSGGMLAISAFVDAGEAESTDDDFTQFLGVKPLAQITFTTRKTGVIDADRFDARYGTQLKAHANKLGISLEEPLHQETEFLCRSIYYVYAEVPIDIQTIFSQVIEKI